MTHHNNQGSLYYSATTSSATMSEVTSPINSHTNSVAVVDKDPVLGAWQRYERLKAIDNEKNTLIEVLFLFFLASSKN
jgi:hypothetical protein